MRRIILLIIVSLCPAQILFSQTKYQSFGNDEINIKFLEHLVKIKIDSVRLAHNCNILVNDSILYIASKHHSQYMLKNLELTHEEKGNKYFKTPQLRVEYFGGKDYQAGENVLETFYNKNVVDKNGIITKTFTYESLANSIVNGWINSPGHFKNMITPSYQITGLSIVYDTETKKVYACQKFAYVPYKYSFTESKAFFKYSDYVPPKINYSFNGVSNKLLDCKHEWGVKHKDSSICNSCREKVLDNPFLSIEIINKSFILRIENSEYVNNLILNRLDGFAVEIVEFKDYMCGNSAYYTKPSRRNHQCGLNGKITKPLYRNDLIKGYKQRKKILAFYPIFLMPTLFHFLKDLVNSKLIDITANTLK